MEKLDDLVKRLGVVETEHKEKPISCSETVESLNYCQFLWEVFGGGDGDDGGDGGDGDESLGLGSWWQPHVCLNTHYNLTKLKHNPLVLIPTWWYQWYLLSLVCTWCQADGTFWQLLGNSCDDESNEENEAVVCSPLLISGRNSNRTVAAYSHQRGEDRGARLLVHCTNTNSLLVCTIGTLYQHQHQPAGALYHWHTVPTPTELKITIENNWGVISKRM